MDEVVAASTGRAGLFAAGRAGALLAALRFNVLAELSRPIRLFFQLRESTVARTESNCGSMQHDVRIARAARQCEKIVSGEQLRFAASRGFAQLKEQTDAAAQFSENI